jgi:hypothetical protein
MPTHSAKNADEVSNIPPLALAVRDALTPGRGKACPVNAKDIVEAVRYATAICLEVKESSGAKTPKLEALLDKGLMPPAAIGRMADPALADRRIVSARNNLLVAVGMLGTHGGKVPDARLTPGAMVPMVEATARTDAVVGVHSGSVASSHPMSGAGNAAQNAQLRFLCLALRISDGPPISLASLLAGDSEEHAALLAGFGDDAASILAEVGAAAERRFSSMEGVPGFVHPDRSQIFFPVDDGRYVAVSPLYPYVLGAELHARIQARLWAAEGADRQHMSVRIAHVGGTKPWNTGLLATYISGRFPRLVGMPQREFAFDGAAVVRQFVSQGMSVSGGDIPGALVDAFFTAFTASNIRPNVGTRTAVLEAVGNLCDAALSNLALIARENGISMAVRGKTLAGPDGSLPEGSREIARLLGMAGDDPPEEADIDRAASEVAAKVSTRLRGQKMGKVGRTFIPDGAMDALIVGVARQRIQEFV